MAVDPNCREDASDSIVIGGKIDDGLLTSLIPEIAKLKQRRVPRITVYINSNGGVIEKAEALEKMLSTPSPDDYRPVIITVAVGSARSAAASLLASGDYAIAYPAASIHFHGARLFDYPEVTTESASYLVNELSLMNTRTALKLAEKSAARAVLRYGELKPHFPKWRAEKKHWTDLECFAHGLKMRLTAQGSRAIVDEALGYWSTMEGLSEFVSRNVRGSHEVPRGVLDARVLKFLSDTERAEFEQLQMAPVIDQEKFHTEKVAPKMQPFWYFVVCVWRCLQKEENPLPPSDAYWLGIIDEVAGTKLAALRRATERDPDPPVNPPTADSST